MFQFFLCSLLNLNFKVSRKNKNSTEEQNNLSMLFFVLLKFVLPTELLFTRSILSKFNKT